ncbi:hypothetical protein KCU88_g1469, partial [Aureobasidium melanogenum]
MQPYTNQGPVNCDIDFDASNIKGKTAVVTGGANGIGEAYVRALVNAGASAFIADLDEEEGRKLEQELGSSVKFVKCNVTVWSDQLAVFKKSLSLSPSGRIDIVIANAGIAGGDSVYFTDVEAEEPEEPRLNVLGNAMKRGEPLDQVLVLQGSLAGYVGLPGAPQYQASKYGRRGVFKSLRLTEWQHNIRVGYIAPWFIETKIMSEAVLDHLKNANTQFATVDDAASALSRIVADKSIHGRSLAILPRSLAPRGYVDLCDDDQEGTLLYKLQEAASKGTHRSSLSAESQKTSTQW